MVEERPFMAAKRRLDNFGLLALGFLRRSARCALVFGRAEMFLSSLIAALKRRSSTYAPSAP